MLKSINGKSAHYKPEKKQKHKCFPPQLFLKSIPSADASMQIFSDSGNI